MWNGTVTNAGLALLQEWIMGSGTLTVDGAKTGTGTVPLVQLMSQLDVAGTAHTVGIIGYSAVTDGVKYQVQIQAATTAYTAMQVGLFAHVGTGSSMLLALFQADSDSGISVPASTSMPDFSTIFTALVQMANSGTLSVTIDTSAFVTMGQVATLAEAQAYLKIA